MYTINYAKGYSGDGVIGLSGSIALAQILYSSPFTYLTDPITKVRSLKNVGSGTENAVVNSGQGMEFTGTQYVDTDTTGVLSLWIFDYIDSTWHIVSTPANPYRIENRTIGHYFKLNTTHTQNDIDLLNLNPELIVDLVLGDLTTNLSFSASDVELYQPSKESGGAIHNLSAPLSDELVHNGAFATSDLSGFSFNRSYGEVANSELVITNNNGGTQYGVYINANLVAGKKYIIEFDSVSVNGVLVNNPNVYKVPSYSYVGTWEIGKYNVMTFTAEANQSSIYVRLSYASSNGDTMTMDNISIKEFVGDSVTNFSPPQFTNADQLSTGVPLTMYKQDASGRITEKALDYLVGGEDGRNVTLPLDTPQDYAVVKDIGKIEGDSTSLTITNIDTTTVVVP